MWHITVSHHQYNAVLHRDCLVITAVLAIVPTNTDQFPTISGFLKGRHAGTFLLITLVGYILCETILNNIDSFTVTLQIKTRYPTLQICTLEYADKDLTSCLCFSDEISHKVKGSYS